MSLDWQFYEVDGEGRSTGQKLGATEEGQQRWERLTTEEAWPITERLIWSTMMVGVPSITRASAGELAERLAQLGFVTGQEFGSRWWNIPVEEVEARAGLRTNSSKISAAEWRKRIAEEVERVGRTRVEAAEARALDQLEEVVD
jgi:hypothetical protein